MLPITKKINTWLINYLYLTGDSKETLLLKKMWWGFNVGGLPFLLLMSFIIGYNEGLQVVIINYIWVLGLLSGLVIFHFYKKGIEGYALASQLGIVILASVKVYFLGGLLTAGGAIFIGLIGPLYALTLPNKKRAFFVFILYMSLMIGVTFIQPENPKGYLIYYHSLGFTLGITMAFIGLFYYTRRVEKLKQEEKRRMSELDEFKTKFYTNITHEFRTPLTIILGVAEQMKKDHGKQSEKGFEMIKRNGRNLLNLTNQMLDLSKLETNAMPVNLIQDDIALYIKYLIESFHSLAQAKKIRLLFSADPTKIMMDFDPDKIQDIVSNLISNAIKFTPKSGLVDVSVSKEDKKLKSQLIVSVKDTGLGIPKENLPNVFERYFQMENQKKQKTEGTGLGLALTRELVKLLNGKISLQSVMGKGSTFTITLPITNKVQDVHILLSKEIEFSGIHSKINEQLTTAADYQKSEKLLLLIVEDNEDVVQYLHSLLSDNYHIEVACNGSGGLKKAFEIIPDLVISDVMMPVMDGITFCENLKDDLRTSHIPIILLTARADTESKMQGLKAGADVYLAKPFNRKELFLRIEKLIKLRSTLQHRYKMIATLNDTVEPAPNHFLHKEDTFIQKVRQTLEVHISEDEFGIAELCRALSMSRSQLYRKFAALTDTSVHRFIRKLRLTKANELLLTTELNVSEVAYDTGFKNPAHFSRVYSEEFGIAPSKARS